MSKHPSRYFTIVLVSLTLAIAACSKQSPPKTEQATAPPVGQLGTVVVPNHYRIELTIDPSKARFGGTASIDITLNDQRSDIWLHGKNLNVTDVHLIDDSGDHVKANYEERDESGVALVALDEVVGPGRATLNFSYDAPFNSASHALFKIDRGDDSYAATQFQPTGARQVFPGFDEPGFKVPFDLAFITRADDVVVTTTPEAAFESIQDGYVRHAFETTRPLPTYLIAIAVGPYDLADQGAIKSTSIRSRKLPLRAIAAKGQGEQLQHALTNTGGILGALEDYFGTPYPYKKLDLIAVPESFGGAMENVGAITYDEYLLLLDEESPLNQRRAHVSVHAHELAHMWFGNLVTPKWWNDIWLNESFASWMENKAAEAYWPQGEFDRETLKSALGAMSNDSLASARRIREPIEHNNEIGSAFDGITYAKGGGVLAMLERYVGEDEFQAGVQLHMERYEDGNASAEEFIQSLAEGSEHAEIDGAFTSFIEQAGVPLVSVGADCRDGQKPQLTMEQSRYAPLGSTINVDANVWQIPMCLSYFADGSKKNTCVLLSEKNQSVQLDAESCPAVVHPNADGAGYYRFALAEEGWQKLVAVIPDLPASEALVLGDSLDAAFRAGSVSAETYVSGVAALVDHTAWDVADEAANNLEKIEDIISIDQLARVHRAYRSIAGRRFERIGAADDPGSQLLRQRLQRFLIVIAKDPDLRAPLAEKAAAQLGLNREPDSATAPSDQLETIFSVGVQDLGEPFFDLLMTRAIASDDPAFRRAAIGALARVEDPSLVMKLQDATLQGNFKGIELIRILFRQMARIATTELTFAWLKEHDDEIITQIPETFRSNIVPAFGSSFCSSEAADEWQKFVTSHADKLPGYELDLAQTVESIQLCTALRQERATSLVAALEKHTQ